MSIENKIMDAFENNHVLSIDGLQEVIPEADQSTLYRNLMQMERDGVLERVQTKGAIKYELTEEYQKHDHFVCQDCDSVKAIHIEADSVSEHVPEGSSFSVTIEGVCAECN